MQARTAADLRGTGYVAATPRAAPQGFPPAAGAVRTSGGRVGTTLAVPLLAIGIAVLLMAVPAGTVLITAGAVVVVLRVVLRSVTTYSEEWVGDSPPVGKPDAVGPPQRPTSGSGHPGTRLSGHLGRQVQPQGRGRGEPAAAGCAAAVVAEHQVDTSGNPLDIARTAVDRRANVISARRRFSVTGAMRRGSRRGWGYTPDAHPDRPRTAGE